MEQLQVFLETTGVYQEALALYLHDRGVQIFVLDPARVREYAVARACKARPTSRTA